MTITEVTYTTEVNQFLLDLSSLRDDSFALKYKELKVLDLNRALKYENKKLLTQLFNKLKYLTQLKTLDLSENGINSFDHSKSQNVHGNSVKELFEGLGKLTELEVLNLNNNTIGVKNLESNKNNLGVDFFSKALGNLTKLKVLNLANNHLKEDADEGFYLALKKLSSTLEVLDLSRNYIAGDNPNNCDALKIYKHRGKPNGDERVKYLAEALKDLKNLKILDLRTSGIKKDSQFVPLLNALIESGAPLEKLNLSCNHAGKKGGEALANLVKYTPTLKVLVMQHTYMGATSPIKLFKALPSNLEHLDLDYSLKTSNDVASELANMLKNSSKLTYLCISNNNISNEAAEKIAEGIRENVSLTTLNLSYNKIGLEGAKKIAEGIRENSSLTTLNLSYNKIGLEGAKKIAEALEGKQFENLILSLNNFNSGNGSIKDLFHALSRIKVLKKIDISNNNLSIIQGQEMAKILKSLPITEINYFGSYRFLENRSNEAIDNAINAHKAFNDLLKQSLVISTPNVFKFLVENKEYLENPFVKKLLFNPTFWQNDQEEINKFGIKELLFIQAIKEFNEKITQVKGQLRADLLSKELIEKILLKEPEECLKENRSHEALKKALEYVSHKNSFEIIWNFTKNQLVRESTSEEKIISCKNSILELDDKIKLLLSRDFKIPEVREEAKKLLSDKIESVKKQLRTDLLTKELIEEKLEVIEKYLEENRSNEALEKVLKYVSNEDSFEIIWNFTKNQLVRESTSEEKIISCKNSILELDNKIKSLLSRDFKIPEVREEAEKLLSDKIESVKEILSDYLPKRKVIEEIAKLLSPEHKLFIAMHSYTHYFNDNCAKQTLRKARTLSAVKEEQTKQIEDFYKNQLVALEKIHGFDKNIEVSNKQPSIEYYILSQGISKEYLKFVKSNNNGFDEETGIFNAEDFLATTFKNQILRELFCCDSSSSKASQQQQKNNKQKTIHKIEQKTIHKVVFLALNSNYITSDGWVKLVLIGMKQNKIKELRTNQIQEPLIGKKRKAEDDIFPHEENLKRLKLTEEGDYTKQKIDDNNYQDQDSSQNDTSMIGLGMNDDNQIPQ
ncbi:MAG: hypothetical protein K9G11_02215 [Rickettsiaceae bacterium]|nr:hypothetical protein [Rickettsiaceae bacterium]